jgi:hypothetical protein
MANNSDPCEWARSGDDNAGQRRIRMMTCRSALSLNAAIKAGVS